jgi:SpoVK/Ycf46/Vps4 family AAA+-type ATPase
MRARHVTKAAGGTADTVDSRYAQAKTARWILNILHPEMDMDYKFGVCLHWIFGSWQKILIQIEKKVAQMPQSEETVQISAKLHRLSRKAKKSPRIYNQITDIVEEYPCLEQGFYKMVRDECAAAAAIISKEKSSLYRRARQRLRRIFGLSEDACALCEFLFIKDAFNPVEEYFENELEIFKFSSRKKLAAMLDMKPAALQTCLSELISWGICEMNHNHSYCNLTEGLESFWEESSLLRAQNLFCRPLQSRAKTLPLESFDLPPDDVDHVRALLESKGDFPVHILLYGEPGTGKTSFVCSLARTLKFKAWTVPCTNSSRGEREEGTNRRAGLNACLNMASKNKRAFVLVDEAERLLDTGDHFGWTGKDKAWLNDFLEQPGRRVFWIVNDIENVHPSVRRRFTYSVRFKPLNCEERRRRWKTVLREQRVTSRLPEEHVKKFARDYPVSPAVMASAIRQAKALSSGKTDFAGTVERVLRSHVTLTHNGAKLPAKSSLMGEYSLEGVCLEGSVSELLDRCRRVDVMMRKEKKTVRPGGATMLFYGPPGSGKSALAKYLADELERELIVKRASDLLSPFVGMSEQNVARAFQEAEEAVLVIDEADSFLYSRDSAARSWENTLVNEFLTALEACRGFCVCTTNRMKDMDEAAIRRFSFKIAFGYAGIEQTKALYKSLLAPLAGGKLPKDVEEELSHLQYLTPGDFHTVKSQHWLVEHGSVTHAQLIESLAREAKLKRDGQARRMGF